MQKAINPVAIWANGESKSANLFSMVSIQDDLSTSATFYYQLMESDTEAEPTVSTQLAQGNLTLGGTEYPTWDGSNEWIMNWAAGKLNLTFAPGAEIV
jgi:hypothetical protein